jgi:hypothetical protein
LRAIAQPDQARRVRSAVFASHPRVGAPPRNATASKRIDKRRRRVGGDQPVTNERPPGEVCELARPVRAASRRLSNHKGSSRVGLTRSSLGAPAGENGVPQLPHSICQNSNHARSRSGPLPLLNETTRGLHGGSPSAGRVGLAMA